MQDEHATVLFNGSAQGHVTLNFPCPADLLPADQMSGGCRLRLRLMRADGLYRLPCRQHVPLITGLRFSYSYRTEPLAPCAAHTLNNFCAAGPAGPVAARAEHPSFYLFRTAGCMPVSGI